MIVDIGLHLDFTAVYIGMIEHAVEYVIYAKIYSEGFVKEHFIYTEIDGRLRMRVRPVFPITSATPPK